MTDEVRTLTVTRDLPFPRDRVWRALTQKELLAEWLMKGDFAPEVGHDFRMAGDWGHVDCTVLGLEKPERLSYSWEAFDLKSVVTFTLEEVEGGTRLVMEQTGFTAEQSQAFHGARAGWTAFLARLEEVLRGGAGQEG